MGLTVDCTQVLRIETKLGLTWGKHVLDSIRYSNRELKPINRVFKDRLQVDDMRFDSVSTGGNMFLGLGIPGRSSPLQMLLGGQDAWLVRSARYVISLPRFYHTIFVQTIPQQLQLPRLEVNDIVHLRFSIVSKRVKQVAEVESTARASFHISEHPLRVNGKADSQISPLKANGTWVFRTEWLDANALDLKRPIPSVGFLSCTIEQPSRASIYESPLVSFTALCRKLETAAGLEFDGGFNAGRLEWVSPLTRAKESASVYGAFVLSYDDKKGKVRVEVTVQSFSPSRRGLRVDFIPLTTPFYAGK